MARHQEHAKPELTPSTALACTSVNMPYHIVLKSLTCVQLPANYACMQSQMLHPQYMQGQGT